MRLRLYVASGSPRSLAAQATLRATLQTLGIACEVEVVDVHHTPERALEDGVLVTPMLVRVEPAPRCVLVGTLADREALLRMLDGNAR